MTSHKLRRLLLVLAFVLTASAAAAQMRSPVMQPEYKNAIGFGPSVGSFYNKGSYFFGAGLDYGRVIKGPWSFGLGLAWDREIEKPGGKPSTQVNTLTFIPTASYALSRRVTLTSGVGQGFMDDDNPERKMRFVKGSLGTGVVLGIGLPDIPFLSRDAVGLSVSWEYTFGEAQPSISFDLGVSFGF